MSGGTKELKVIKFKGGKSDFWGWKHKFQSLAVSRGYHDLLMKAPSIIPAYFDDQGQAVNFDQDQQAIVKENKKGVSELLLSMEKEQDVRLVVSTFSFPNYPDGNLPKAWDNLKAKYEPRTEDEKERLLQKII